MKSDQYHEDVVKYNRAFAEFAEDYANDNDIEDPVVERWITHIAKQHRYHQNRHESILKRRSERENNIADDKNEEVSA